MKIQLKQKKVVLLSILILSTFINYAQSLNEIDLPTGFSTHGNEYPIVFRGNLYLRLDDHNNFNSVIAKYDGNTVTPIPSPANFDGNGTGYLGATPIIYDDNLYLRYFHNNYSDYGLIKYDGTNLAEVPLPSGFSKSYSGSPIVFEGNLFLKYSDRNGSVLVKYDGTNLTEINSPVANASYLGQPFIYRNNLYMRYQDNSGTNYLLKYDGNSLSEIPNPSGSFGYTSGNTIFNGEVYLKYRKNDGNYVLMKYDGTNLTEVPSPAGYTGSDNGYSGVQFDFNNEIYLRYQGDDDLGHLLKYDGSTLTEIPLPSNFSLSYRSPTLYNNNWYLNLEGNNDTIQFYKFDGIDLTPVPIPNGFKKISSIYQTDSFIWQDIMYIPYVEQIGFSIFNTVLYKYDGTNLIELTNPNGFTNYQGSLSFGYTGYRRFLSDFNNNLYLVYGSDTGSHHLFVLSSNCSATSSIDTQNACNSFTWIDGNTYMSNNNTAQFRLTNANGCDSIVTLNLTIDSIDVTTTTLLNPSNTSTTIFANNTNGNVTYQWIDCDNANTIIPGETSSNFNSSSNGSFAVIVNENGCIDTSACVNTAVTSINELHTSSITTYPNPVKNNLTVLLDAVVTTWKLSVTNTSGQQVYQTTVINDNQIIIDAQNWAKGLYYIKILSNNDLFLKKIVVTD